MGNQQERLLAWLAGILDGEGTITFQVYTFPDGRVRITPYIAVVNSDHGILDTVMSVLKDLTKNSPHGKPRLCKQTSGPNKECFSIRLDGVIVKYALERISPYLRSDAKRRAASVVLQYLEGRKNGLLLRDSRGRIQRAGYTRAEIDLVCSIRSHKLAKSSEAICSAPNVIG